MKCTWLCERESERERGSGEREREMRGGVRSEGAASE